MEIPQMNKK